MATIESRLEAALRDWKEREQRYEKLFSPGVLRSREFLKEKLKHYDEIRAKVMASHEWQDSIAMRALLLERKLLARQIYPNVFRRLLERVVSSFMLNNKVAKVQQHAENNEAGIHSAMIKAGLGDHYPQALQQMKQGNREFSLPVSYQVSEQEKMDLQLNFTKDESGKYHFENYKATLFSAVEKSKPHQHTFEVTQHMDDNTDMAYNLLAGRAIKQTDSQSWQQLDFNDKDSAGNYRMKYFPANYGFNMEQTLRQLPLKENDLSVLIEKLSRGERVASTLLINNKEVRYFLEANPQKKEVAIYDSANQKLAPEQLNGNTGQKKKEANMQQLIPNKTTSQNQVKAKSIKV